MSAQQQTLSPSTSLDDLLQADVDQDPTVFRRNHSVVQTTTQRRPWKRGRNSCWTLNNPTLAEKQFWTSLARLKDFRTEHHVRYVVFQSEISESGTPHLQGYLELTVPMRIGQLKTHFGERVHHENRRGTQAQAADYAKKEDTRVVDGLAGEGGEPTNIGKDTVAVVAAALKEGSNLSEVAENYPVSFILHGAKIRSFALQQIGRRRAPPKVIIYYGVTGTGKSATADTNWPDAYWVPMPLSGGWWWPFYSGEETVIIDEFANQFKYHTMLRLLDRYPFMLQEKGSSMQLCATTKRIVFTTNIHPHQWYHNKSWADKAPLRRRFRDFAKIYTFADNSTWNHPIMVEGEPEDNQ